MNAQKYLIGVLIFWNVLLTLFVIGLADDMWGRLGLIARFGRMQ